MKKTTLFATLLAAAIVASSGINSLAARRTEDTDIQLLSTMSIMQGDGNGFNGEGSLTREQLAKIAVFVTEPHFTGKSRVSPYSDVPYTRWSAPYIERASEKGYFSGYPDGSFRPEATVTPEELCKVMLNFLGYNYDDTLGGWASSQLTAAQTLGLLDGAAVAAGEPITRSDAAKIIVNTLLAQKSGGGYLIEDSGFKYYKDAVLISEKDTGYITTSAGVFEKGSVTADDILKKGDIVTDKVGAIAAFFPAEQIRENYAVKKLFPDRMELYAEDGTEVSLDTEQSTTIYNNSEGKNYIQAYSDITAGSDLSVFRDNGRIDYIAVNDVSSADSRDYIVKSTVSDGIAAFGRDGDEFAEIEGDAAVYEGSTAYTFSQVKDSLKIGDKLTVYRNAIGGIKYIYLTRNAISSPKHISELDIASDTKIIIDGKEGKASDIGSLDICYYISETDTLLVYTKRITGIYEKALPTKDNISSIRLSGKEYVIDGEEAIRKLSTYGSIAYGDAVTLMFGKDDTVVDAALPQEDSTIVGYLEDCALTKKEDENGNEISVYTATVLLPDGTTSEYASDKDYSGYECKAVRVTFENGEAHLTALSANKSVDGTYSRSLGTLGSYSVADDVKIIDTMSDPTNKSSGGMGKKIFSQRLDGAKLTSKNILYANIENNCITELILNDYTGDIYDYGIVLNAADNSMSYLSGSYEVNINGEYKSFTTTNSKFSVKGGDVIRYFEENSVPSAMQTIEKYSGTVSHADDMYAYIGENKYRLSDELVIYHKIAGTESGSSRRYEVISKSRLSDFDKLTAYYDKLEESGGRIRVIVAE